MKSTDLERLPSYDSEGRVLVVVESPRGARAKLKYDADKRAFVFGRSLALGVAYPYDWGFIPSTRAEDGDPLDAMVLFDAPCWPGVVIPSRPIGLIEVSQSDEEVEEQRNDRVIAVPDDDPRRDITEISPRERKELENFFVLVTSLTHKHVHILGWKGPAAAHAAIAAARRGIDG